MKAKIGLFLFTMLAMAGMGFAAPGDEVAATSYFNLKSQVNGYGMNATTILVLSQEAKDCKPVVTPGMGMWGAPTNGCVASVTARCKRKHQNKSNDSVKYFFRHFYYILHFFIFYNLLYHTFTIKQYI